MSTSISRSKGPIVARPARDTVPRRSLVTAGVVTFAIRDWSLWVLLRDGPADPRDIDFCYLAGANSYIQKPVNVADFFRAIQEVKQYWFEIVNLPTCG